MSTPKRQFPRHDLAIPPGRLIAGSLTEMQTEYKGKPKDTPSMWFAVAVLKTQPGVDQVLATIYQAAQNDYHFLPAIQAQAKLWLGATAFAWKIHDGDTAEKWKGREGAAGCWIFSFGTTFDIKCCDQHNVQMDPNLINLGDYVDVHANMTINGQTDHTAGIFLNPNGVRFLGYGQRITMGPTFQEMFANRPAALPPGASPTPVAAGPAGGMPAPASVPGAVPPAAPAGPTPPGVNVPGVPAGAVPGLAVPGTPAPGFPTASPSSPPPGVPAGVTPHPGILTPPPASPPPPPPAAAPTPQQIAAQYNVQHYDGYRYDPGTNSYVAA